MAVAAVIAATSSGNASLTQANTRPAVEADYKPGDTFKDCDLCPEMVVVPAGEFTMGSARSERDHRDEEGPQHMVTIAKPFAVGKFEVTKAEFGAFVRESNYDAGDKCRTFENGKVNERSGRSWRNPGFSQTGNDPVTCVNWNDAEAYVAWLSKKTGKAYRLPSEAEWEYVARAGTTTPFSTGQTITTDQANFHDSDTSNGSRQGHSRGKTVPVGSFAANAFGLHDMHGNVCEWVGDCLNGNYSGAPSDSSAWTAGDCGFRILRGGSWADTPGSLRSAVRFSFSRDVRFSDFGFRVARTLNP